MVTKTTSNSFLAGSRVTDVGLSLVLFVVMFMEIWVFGGRNDRFVTTTEAVVGSCIAAVAAGSLMFRRSYAFPAFLTNTAMIFAFVTFTGPSDVYQYTNLIALFSLSLYDRRWFTSVGPLLSIAGIVYYFRTFPDEGGLAIANAVSLLWMVAWLGGWTIGSKIERDRLQTERDLNYELAETRKVRLELEGERTRMAHELHDIVGHTLNVMLVHAGAARRALPENTEQAEEALAIIESTGRSAMGDLDRVLGLLRDEAIGSERTPLPGLADLVELAGNASDDRLEVVVDLTGAPDDLPHAVQLTIYRIAQEALTNVLKHADASKATILVAQRDGMIELSITDDGDGLGGRPPGRGMSGMKQRAAIHGGTVTATDGESGGTMVSCVLPLGFPADQTEDAQ